MFGAPFTNSLLPKYIALFGTLFNNIQIIRYNSENKKDQVFKVPLNFGPKEHWLARVEADPEFKRPYSELVPRIAYEMVGFDYDPNRKLSSTVTYQARIPTENNKVATTRVFAPVGYDIHFRLTIMAKTNEDATKIIEQIVPYFTPDWTVSAKLMDDMPNFSLDIPVVMTGMDYSDLYDQAYEKRRVITWTLDFTMKAYLFGPTQKSKVIKIATVNFIDGDDHNTKYSKVIVRPGLTADGKPTTDASESVPVTQIEEGDDYGYIVIIESGNE